MLLYSKLLVQERRQHFFKSLFHFKNLKNFKCSKLGILFFFPQLNFFCQTGQWFWQELAKLAERH
jgi:hypothetical protein